MLFGKYLELLKMNIKFLLGLLISALPLLAQGNTHLYEIPYYHNGVKIDGNLDDWEKYFEYSFRDTLNRFTTLTNLKLQDTYPKNFDFKKLRFPKSRNNVIFRAFWNKENFYCAFIVEDKHLFAEHHGRIDKPQVHLNDGIELYIDTQNEASPKMDVNDYQFLIDIRNNSEVFKGDLKEILADTLAVPKDYAQNILFHSSVKIYGTLNDEKEDSSYVIEIAIPFAAIGVEPETGMKMHLDVCVNDIDYPNSQTVTVEEASTAMWPFNWSGYSDFGYPKFWKEVAFVGSPNWFEVISEKYKSQWAAIYIATVFISLILISFLLYRAYKLRQLPRRKDLKLNKIVPPEEEENLSVNEKILKRASEIIIQKKSEPLRSEDVSRELGISLRTFQRITRSELNLTPTNYICVIKLNLAAEFLKEKKGNVADAAYEFGFSDPSYFSKTFKKHFEISPTEFIKKNSKKA